MTLVVAPAMATIGDYGSVTALDALGLMSEPLAIAGSLIALSSAPALTAATTRRQGTPTTWFAVISVVMTLILFVVTLIALIIALDVRVMNLS